MLKVFEPIRVLFLLLLPSLLLCTLAAQAQSDDWHLSPQGAPVFFMRSAFAHGYMHGYEEGFHRGDLDLQMTRPFQPLKDQQKYKKVSGYRSQFGDRVNFEDGYRKGYAVGYIDAISGRDFRALQLVREGRAATSAGDQAVHDARLDRAFIAGYDNGQKTGLHDGRAATAVAVLDSIDCADALGKSAKRNGDYCAAYEGGYRLGYSDGYTNQHAYAKVVAQK